MLHFDVPVLRSRSFRSSAPSPNTFSPLMPDSERDSSSSSNREPESTLGAPGAFFRNDSRASSARAGGRRSVGGLLSLLYRVPARWVGAFVFGLTDGSPWDGGNREFLCGPFITDVHSPDA